MNVKKMTVLLATLSILPATAMADSPTNSTITFTGEVLESGCEVSLGSGNALTVDLGSVNKSVFESAGAQYGKTGFSINLSGCPESLTQAQVRFEGTPDASDSALLSAGPGVEGIALMLMTADSSPLGLNQVNNYQYALQSTAENKLNFYAAYKSTADVAQIKAGAVNAVASFSVSYN